MFGVDNETMVPASPPRVWTAITRFDTYHAWHPFVRISGLSEPGRAIEYSFRIRPDQPRFRTMFARIREIQTHERLVIRFGLGWLVSFEEAYVLMPAPGGTRLLHSLRCRGLLSLLLSRRGARRNFTNLLEATDMALARYLAPVKRPPPGRARPRRQTGPVRRD